MSILLLAAQSPDGLGPGAILFLISLVVMGATAGEKGRWAARAQPCPEHPGFGPGKEPVKLRLSEKKTCHLRYFDGE